jgi:hypothetical protein
VIARPAKCPLASNLLSGAGKNLAFLPYGMVSVSVPDVVNDDRPHHAG